MTRKSRINYLKAISHNVERKKMYKAKKQWIVAGVSFLVATGLGALGSHLTTHADVKTSTQAQKQPASNSSSSSGSSTDIKPIQSASTKLGSVQSKANYMYQGLMLNAANPSNQAKRQQYTKKQQLTSSSDCNNVTNSAKPKTNSASNQGTSNTTSASTINNASNSGSNNSSAELENKSANAKSNIISSGSNKDIPSSAPINQKGSFNSAYQKYLAQMGNIDAKANNMNIDNTSSNSNNQSNQNVKVTIPKHNLGGDNIQTGNYEGLNYRYDITNQSLEFTSGEIDNSDTAFFLNSPQLGGNLEYNTNGNLKYVTFDNDINTSQVTNMDSMFKDDIALQGLNLGNSFNTSNVTNMSYMFNNDQNLTNLYLGNQFNTDKVTNMSHMFQDDYHLTHLNIGRFNTSNVTDMSNMFYEDGLTNLDLSNFNTEKVSDMETMFFGDGNLTELNLGRNFNTSNVTNMGGMFVESSLQKLVISSQGSNFNDQSMLPTMYQEVNGTDQNGKPYTLSTPNDFSQGNVGTFMTMKNVPTDTINYQLNGKTVTTQTFTATSSDYNGNGYNKLDVTSSNDTSIPSSDHLVNHNNLFNYDGGTYNVSVAPNYSFDSATTTANGYINKIPVINSGAATADNNKANTADQDASADSNMSAVNTQKSQENSWYKQVQADSNNAYNAQSTAQSYANDISNEAKSNNINGANNDITEASSYAQQATGDANAANGLITSMNDNDSTSAIVYSFASAVQSATSNLKSLSVSSDGASDINKVAQGYAGSAKSDTNSLAINNQASLDNSAVNSINSLIGSVTSANGVTQGYISSLEKDASNRNAAAASADLSRATTAYKSAQGVQTSVAPQINSIKNSMNSAITPINSSNASKSVNTANGIAKQASDDYTSVSNDSSSASSDSKAVASALSKTSSTTDDYNELSSLSAKDSSYDSQINTDSSNASKYKSLANQAAQAVSNDSYSTYNSSNSASYFASSAGSNDMADLKQDNSDAFDAEKDAQTQEQDIAANSTEAASAESLNTDNNQASQNVNDINTDSSSISNDIGKATSISKAASNENTSANSSVASSVNSQNEENTKLSSEITSYHNKVTAYEASASSASSAIAKNANLMKTSNISATSTMIASDQANSKVASSEEGKANSAKSYADKALASMTATNFSNLYNESSEASYDNSIVNVQSSSASSMLSVANSYNSSNSQDINGMNISNQAHTDSTFNNKLINDSKSVSSENTLASEAVFSANNYTSAGNSSSADIEEQKASSDASSAHSYFDEANGDYALITDETTPLKKSDVIKSDTKAIHTDSASTNKFSNSSNNSNQSASNTISHDATIISKASASANGDVITQNMSDANAQKSLADSAYNNASEEAMIENGIASDNNPHVYGVATVHLVYNVLQAGTKNIVSQTTKDVYIPINTRVNANSMIINPWNYSKSYYDQSNSDWAINFKPSDFKDYDPLSNSQFTNLSDNPTHTFTYNATRAGDVMVNYYTDTDTDNNARISVSSDNLGNFDGLVGQQVTLTTSDVGTGDGIYGKLDIPAGYHLAHQLNTITLQAPNQAVSSRAHVPNVGLLLMAPVVKNAQNNNTNKPTQSSTTNNSSSNQAQSNEASNSNVVIPNTPNLNIAPATSENNNHVNNNNTRATNTPLQAITAQASHRLDEMNKPARIIKLVHHHSNNKNELFYAHIHHAQVPVDKLPRVWTVHQLNKIGRGHTVRFGRVIVTSLSGRHSYEFRILKHVYLHKKIYFTHGKFHSLKPSHKAVRIRRIFLVQQGRHIYIRLELRLNHHTYFITGKKPYVKGPYKLL